MAQDGDNFGDNSVDNSEGLSWREGGAAMKAPILGQFNKISTCSSRMARVLVEAQKFAASDGCVLIQGESGTGKELMAEGIHQHSKRREQPFVTLNCSALNESLLESELFGHQKGAFTGAHRAKMGFFTRASGGTLFLDEIGDMPLALQAKLLRVLQQQSFHPVGSTELQTTDVRIIAATNVNLSEAVRKKRFRLDLYYRLNVLPIEMPPLRHRLEDLDLLIREFVAQGEGTIHFSARCIERLRFYHWPGNIRELENLTTRMMITLHATSIDIDDLPAKYAQPPGPPEIYEPDERLDQDAGVRDQAPLRGAIYELPSYVEGATSSDTSRWRQQYAPAPAVPVPSRLYLKDVTPLLQLPAAGIQLIEELKDLENHLIKQALAITGHNKHRAAQLLGIKRTTLTGKLKKLKQELAQQEALTGGVANVESVVASGGDKREPVTQVVSDAAVAVPSSASSDLSHYPAPRL